MKHSKRYQSNTEKVDRTQMYAIEEGVNVLKSIQIAKFDETVDIAIKLGVDPKKADQMVRGTVSLPHGTGKKVSVLVLCKPPKDKEALDAGADMAGLEEYIEKIEKGWGDVDAIVATPDVMKDVGKLGKFLGRKGLMPNPKAGTVTFEVADAVKQLKAGRIEFRVDKFGNVHSTVGKASFSAEQLTGNIKSLLEQIIRIKPASVKGQYLRAVTISSTMGPGIHIDRASIIEALR
ncbi:50S ribosomal protein L1 [candidate division KSB1 bacterium]|nr:50S ribosomal protein L1 [candidate division KSB1 bacterium]